MAHDETNRVMVDAAGSGSMFGWHVPGANPDLWDENGRLK